LKPLDAQYLTYLDGDLDILGPYPKVCLISLSMSHLYKMFVADCISDSTSINTGGQFYVLPGFDASIIGSFVKWLIYLGKKTKL